MTDFFKELYKKCSPKLLKYKEYKKKLVITYPITSGNEYKYILKKVVASTWCNFDLQFLEEPIAALHTVPYLSESHTTDPESHTIDPGSRWLLVFDGGAGTSDIVLVEIQKNGGFNIAQRLGSNECCGNKVNAMLLQTLLENASVTLDSNQTMELLQCIDTWKVKGRLAIPITLHQLGGKLAKLTRTNVESVYDELLRTLFSRTEMYDMIKKILKAGTKIKLGEIGGFTRNESFRIIMRSIFGSELSFIDDRINNVSIILFMES